MLGRQTARQMQTDTRIHRGRQRQIGRRNGQTGPDKWIDTGRETDKTGRQAQRDRQIDHSAPVGGSEVLLFSHNMIP